MSNIWSNIPPRHELRSEADVEMRLVLPLLHELGYESEDIASKHPVVFQEGRAGRRPEADFVCFWGPLRTRDNSLLVVEAKKPGEALGDGKAQGESYAQNLRAPLLVLTNGEDFEIWQMQIALDSQCVLKTSVALLPSQRGVIERVITKAAVREYCRSLSFKMIVEAAADFGDYELVELRRTSGNQPTIVRTLRPLHTAAQLQTLETNGLIDSFPSGAVVVAPSGYGKTTLSRDIFRQAIEERWRGNRQPIPFDVPLPDLEQSRISLVEFMQRRLSAHHPGVTAASFLAMLRDIGATICCDSFDRTTIQFQKKIATEFATLLRDFPRAQLFIFSRAAPKPNLSLPSLELEPLSEDQVRTMERAILSDGSAASFSVVGMMSPTLRSLCTNPLLLWLALDYWTRENDFPRKIEVLFRSWLESVLDTEPSDAVSRVRRDQALTALAEATADAPITGARAITLFNERGISEGVLNELIQCDAVRLTGSVVELPHQGLADYLRAKALISASESELLGKIAAVPVSPDSFFPVLLMAQLPGRALQAALWKRLSGERLGVYFDALRYRFDVSNELRQLDPDKLSKDYLDDLLDGVETPLDGFFPEMRLPAIRQLTGDEDISVAVTGRATAYPGALEYKLHAWEVEKPRVAVATPTFPGTIRGVNLDLSRYRIDSARLLGMTLLRDALSGAVKHLDVVGGPVWAAERLIGRVRYLAKTHGVEVELSDSLDKLDALFKPQADKWIDDGAFFGNEQFPIQSLLDDIATLRAAGVAVLDPWWTRLGWDDNAAMQDDEVYSRILDEQHRREQQIYAEIVEASFPHIASEMIYFPILPIRWKLTVQKRSRYEGLSTIYFHWQPVETWEEAGRRRFIPRRWGAWHSRPGQCSAGTR